MNRHPLDRTALVFGAIFLAIAAAAGLSQITAISLSDGTLFGIAAIAVGAVVLSAAGWQAIVGDPDPTPLADQVSSTDADLSQDLVG